MYRALLAGTKQVKIDTSISSREPSRAGESQNRHVDPMANSRSVPLCSSQLKIDLSISRCIAPRGTPAPLLGGFPSFGCLKPIGTWHRMVSCFQRLLIEGIASFVPSAHPETGTEQSLVTRQDWHYA
jgi:hypothetical protein